MLKAADFQGRWAVKRSIQDRFSDQEGDFEGVAEFVGHDPGKLTYTETGQMRLGQGPKLTATRKYRWVFGVNSVSVFFENGQPFHSFKPEGVEAGTDHPCGDDYYTVTYDFRRWPVWAAEWTVRGPRKNYTSKTGYRPL